MSLSPIIWKCHGSWSTRSHRWLSTLTGWTMVDPTNRCWRLEHQAEGNSAIHPQAWGPKFHPRIIASVPIKGSNVLPLLSPTFWRWRSFFGCHSYFTKLCWSKETSKNLMVRKLVFLVSRLLFRPSHTNFEMPESQIGNHFHSFPTRLWG